MHLYMHRMMNCVNPPRIVAGFEPSNHRLMLQTMTGLRPGDLRRIFEIIDENDDGRVSIEELNRLLEKILGVSYGSDELECSVGKSSLDFGEFVSFYDSISSAERGFEDYPQEAARKRGGGGGVDDSEQESTEDLVEAFKVFDLNDDGFISSEELEDVLSRLGLWDERSGKDCKSMINAYDTNRDGRLDFEEFKSMMLLTIS